MGGRLCAKMEEDIELQDGNLAGPSLADQQERQEPGSATSPGGTA